MKERKLLSALNDMDEELLMEALEEAPRRVRRFRPGTLLAAALMTVLLAVTAGAAVLNGADWFQGFFKEKLGRPLTEGQAVQVRTSTKEYGQSITIDGYTLTLEALIADPSNCYMTLKITAPQGTVLDNEGGYGYQTPRNQEELLSHDLFAPVSGAEIPRGTSWRDIPDGDPGDNQARILLETAIQEGYPNFATEAQWRLTVRDLVATGETLEEDIVLAKGNFVFDITFDRVSAARVTFVEDPIPYTFQLPGFTGTVEGTITACTLQPMGGSMTTTGCDVAAGFLQIPVVMKDGSQVSLQANIFGNGSYSYRLEAPIDLEEVAYILLENGTRLCPIAE